MATTIANVQKQCCAKSPSIYQHAQLLAVVHNTASAAALWLASTQALQNRFSMVCVMAPTCVEPVPCCCSCADESIDEIAAFLGVGEQVAALTAK
jgi:hypothetical protein